MKKWLLIFLCLTLPIGIYAQAERNSKWYQTAIQALKSQPASFGRDTLLIQYYYYLMTKSKIEIQTKSAYVDTITMLSKHTKWVNGNRWTHEAIMHLASEKQALGLWDESNELILKEINRFRSTSDSLQLNQTMLWWANNLWDMGKHDQSLEILQDCLLYANQKQDMSLLSYIYVNLGYNYISKKMYPEAQSSFEKAYVFFASGHFDRIYTLKMFASLKANLIEAYLLNNQREKAETMIPWVENTNRLYGNNFEKYYSYSLFTNAYIEIGDYKKAKKYALKCAYYAKPLASRAHDLLVNTYFYKIYKGLGKYDLALNYLEELKKVEAAIAFDKMNAKVTELQLKYDTEAKQKEINQLTIEQQSQIEKSLLAGLVILIAIIGYVFWNYRKLLQKNKEISKALLKGQTTERKRIAADLHDNLGSTMSALRWSLGAINKNNLSHREQEVYQHVQNTIEQAYDQVRLLSHNFLPEELEKQGLWIALEQFVRKLNKNTPVKFTLQLPQNQIRLEAKTEFELYSICLELVNNILKHAKATEARIECRIQDKECRMVISDNGTGVVENNSSGKGLHNITERVKSLGGTWEVKSAEGNGVVNEIMVNI